MKGLGTYQSIIFYERVGYVRVTYLNHMFSTIWLDKISCTRLLSQGKFFPLWVVLLLLAVFLVFADKEWRERYISKDSKLAGTFVLTFFQVNEPCLDDHQFHGGKKTQGRSNRGCTYGYQGIQVYNKKWLYMVRIVKKPPIIDKWIHEIGRASWIHLSSR